MCFRDQPRGSRNRLAPDKALSKFICNSAGVAATAPDMTANQHLYGVQIVTPRERRRG